MKTGLEGVPTRSLLRLLAKGEDAIAEALPHLRDLEVAESVRTTVLVMEPFEAELRKRGAWPT